MLKWSPVREIKVRSLHLPSGLVSGKIEEDEGDMVAAFDKASLILAAISKSKRSNLRHGHQTNRDSHF